MFEVAQAYVVLSRVQTLSQLFLLSLPEKKIYCNPTAKYQTTSTSQLMIQDHAHWFNETDHFKLVCLNIRSLYKHFSDLKIVNTLLQADIICLTETWLNPNSQNYPLLENFHGYHCAYGNGNGVSVYCKKPVTVISFSSNADHQILVIELTDIVVLVVYKSPKASLSKLKKTISNVLSTLSCSRNIVICGDFNFDFRTGIGNEVAAYLLSAGFTQIVASPTHVDGNCLDHTYVSQSLNNLSCSYFLNYPYYSDHNGICVQFLLNSDIQIGDNAESDF